MSELLNVFSGSLSYIKKSKISFREIFALYFEHCKKPLALGSYENGNTGSFKSANGISS
jgi:hypothetical protein